MPEKEKNHFSEVDGWKSLKATTGRNVDARFYIQYNNFSKWLTSIGAAGAADGISWLNNFAEWTETDVMIKKDQLLMAGFTLADSGSFLSGLGISNPQPTSALTFRHSTPI